MLWTIWYGNSADGWELVHQYFEEYGVDPQNPNIGSMASIRGRGAAAIISLGPSFFNDAAHRMPTSAPTDPRQGQAHTILHEIAHALRLIPDDERDPLGQGIRNDELITEKCGQGLSKIS